VLARNPASMPWRYGIRFRRVFTSTVSLTMVCLAKSASDRFRCAQTRSIGLSSWAYGRQPEHRQSGPGRDQLDHRGGHVGVQIASGKHERSAELLVGGVEQGGVVGLGNRAA
jgi:hypothetical protein